MTLDELREICLSLPGSTEDIKYGSDLCFSVGGKIFLGTRIKGPFRTGIKCDPHDFNELVERDGIVPMPRLAATYWIRIEKDSALTTKEWQRHIKRSHSLVVAMLPKKIRHSIGSSS